MRRILLAASILAGLLSGQDAGASSSATINIDITIVSNLSVSVNSAASSTEAFTWNAAVPNAKLAGSSATVTNDSGARTEKWALAMEPVSLDITGGNQTWSRAASSSSVGADQFALQAVFGSSRTAAGGCPA
ncbi:MAG: hypothetical protein WC881_11330, partial [Elusimicrobiota bacterium]